GSAGIPAATGRDDTWLVPGGDPRCNSRAGACDRLINRKHLIETPAPADLVIIALRRIQALATGDPRTQTLWESRRGWLELADSIPHVPWAGRRLDLVRFSGSQQAELELRGVSGS